MDDIPLSTLFTALGCLIVLSACFSGSETGMMMINRYKLRHLAKEKHRAAMRVSALLEHTDRLIGLILLGNNFVNILASSIATIIALRLLGEAGVALAALLLTIVILIFAELLPKTLAALDPERVAFPASLVLKPLLRLLYPFVWVINTIANSILKAFGIKQDNLDAMALTPEELRSVVLEASKYIPKKHQQMLFGILDLENATVEDIMVPRAEIVGIDLDDDDADLDAQLRACRHTRLPVYRGSLDDIAGILHARKLPRLMDEHGDFDTSNIIAQLTEPDYVPISTQLHTQLLLFQQERKRMSLVVDEYGEIQGLVTLEAILEEIVGEFTTCPQMFARDVSPLEDGSFLVDGSASLREINRTHNWSLPSDGPKTLNGLLLETLESIPEPGTSIKIGAYAIEIVLTTGQAVKTVKIREILTPTEEDND